MTSNDASRCDAVVLFGATGDLAAKMVLPALAELGAREKLDLPIVAVGHSPMSVEALLAKAGERHAAAEPDVTRAIAGLAPRLRYVAGDVAQPQVYAELREALGGSAAPLHYLAIPPRMFAPVVDGLAQAGLVRGGRVAVEKPFGHDLASARALERTIEAAIPESAVLRIDHFLGKDPLRNLAYMRHSTAWLEPLWSAAHVRNVQITMAEDFGLDGRGAFYEKVGALRDVFQNHLMQLVALIAMEPAPLAEPATFGAARIEAIRAIQPIDPGDVVYGQYDGYRDLTDVAPDSRVPTYLAVRMRIDTPRFAGIPFYVRAGKRLPITCTMASLKLTRARLMHASQAETPPDYLRFRLGPGAVSITLDTRRLGAGTSAQGEPVALQAALPPDHDRNAYVNLLRAAIAGDSSMSEEAAGVTAAWRVVENVLRADLPVHPYPQRSWGPAQADRLLAPGEHWFDPTATSG